MNFFAQFCNYLVFAPGLSPPHPRLNIMIQVPWLLIYVYSKVAKLTILDKLNCYLQLSRKENKEIWFWMLSHFLFSLNHLHPHNFKPHVFQLCKWSSLQTIHSLPYVRKCIWHNISMLEGILQFNSYLITGFLCGVFYQLIAHPSLLNFNC